MSSRTTPHAGSETSSVHESTTRATHVVLLLLLFLASGCAALIYEIVWFQLLQLSIGSSAVSLGVLLSAFMGGMCLGSLFLPRFVSPQYHPLRIYALLELAIGVLGMISLLGIPLVTTLYSQLASTGSSDVLMRATICLICLLPPTVLMGATLPAVARWVEPTAQGASRLGFFYGANIVGAVLGCLLAGFYLLRIYDLTTATYVAVAINFLAAALALIAARWIPYAPQCLSEEDREGHSESAAATPWVGAHLRTHWLVYVAILLSGCCALGAEVIWTRQLALVLGATVYSFSIILAVFLTGLGLGSSCGALLARRLAAPGAMLGWFQLLAAGSLVWASVMLAKSIPYWPFLAELATSPWHVFPTDILRAACAVLPGAFFWGASFPLALAAVTGGQRDTGRLVGLVYAANTLGSIVGALSFSVILIGWTGTQLGQQSLIVGCGIAATLAMVSASVAQKRRGEAPQAGWLWGNAPVIGLLSASTVLFVWLVPQTPAELIGFGHRLPYFRFHDKIGNDPLPEFIYTEEGMNASVAVSKHEDGNRGFHVNGKVVASTGFLDMRLQRMLGHLPALIHKQPKSVLVVGCGAGVTAGTFTCYPSVERIVICEIEPLIPEVAGTYFVQENHRVMNDPRVEVHIDDARHFMLTTNEKFDIITSDPIHPWVKGAASLYSLEYFELCKQRLRPGGVVTQWVPLYETNVPAVKSELATFFAAFPQATVWCNEMDALIQPPTTFNEGQPRGLSHDIVLLGQQQATQVDVAALAERIAENDQLRAALQALELADPVTLLSTFAGQASDLQEWLADAQMNRDANLRLQFLAGLAVSEHASPQILGDIVEQRTYPEGLFVNGAETPQAELLLSAIRGNIADDAEGEDLLRELRKTMDALHPTTANE
ncbi:MAG: SAM-dependent methyltransferase [Blastopirellula sp.]|nr:SAM-dependent methyltransferase [Blastopirellula sp.]